MGEAMGLNAALDWLEELRILQVVIELDSQTIVKAIKDPQKIRKGWGNVVWRCVRFLRTNPRSSIEWVRMSCNQAAHVLASWAEQEPNKFWPNSAPRCILSIIQKDMDYEWIPALKIQFLNFISKLKHHLDFQTSKISEVSKVSNTLVTFVEKLQKSATTFIKLQDSVSHGMKMKGRVLVLKCMLAVETVIAEEQRNNQEGELALDNTEDQPFEIALTKSQKKTKKKQEQQDRMRVTLTRAGSRNLAK
ncbi:cytochrome p450 [Trifolium pratense]|uniref:Cytochrome p450 n=1 Tax=Trifolium pratense TaxID=57577 RepID=A0A2K3LCN6_TRIPR|nr:cytochrome p450 [Trifolium pratense]